MKVKVEAVFDSDDLDFWYQVISKAEVLSTKIGEVDKEGEFEYKWKESVVGGSE